jgi:aryl-alcohol dehydrogenase-like predicted oxidoreductase
VIGTWLKNNPDQRRNVVLATKVCGGMDGVTPNHSRLSRGNILDSVYACLARLQVDYIDLLYFHAWDPLTPVDESLETIEDLVNRDLVRYFAVSKFTVDQISLYQAVGEKISSRCRVIAVQNQYDIIGSETAAQPGVLEFAARTGVSFIAFSPLARGLITERYLDLSKVSSGDRLYDEGTLEQDTTEPVMKKLRLLADLAHEWDMQLNQLAIAYMLGLPGMGPIIASASSIEQLESNAAAGKRRLTTEQRKRIATVLQT